MMLPIVSLLTYVTCLRAWGWKHFPVDSFVQWSKISQALKQCIRFSMVNMGTPFNPFYVHCIGAQIWDWLIVKFSRNMYVEQSNLFTSDSRSSSVCFVSRAYSILSSFIILGSCMNIVLCSYGFVEAIMSFIHTLVLFQNIIPGLNKTSKSNVYMRSKLMIMSYLTAVRSNIYIYIYHLMYSFSGT